MTAQMPAARPRVPYFSSGPTTKRPGWSLDALSGAALGRSHRSAVGKAKLAEAVKKPITYSQLVPLQASLDAADAARYHDDGSLPETDNVALIDECYGKRGAGCWGRARQRSRVKRLQERRKSGSNRWGRRNEASSSSLLKKERKEDGVHSPCIFPLPRPESGLPLHERALLDAI